jgi:hypothetical protein
LIEFRFVLGSPQAMKELSEFLLLFFKTPQSVGAILVERIVAARLRRPPIDRLRRPRLPVSTSAMSPEPFKDIWRE